MNNYQLGLIMNSCISVIGVTGVFIITSLAGMFSLGQAAYMAISAYITFVVAKMFGIPLILTAILGLAVSGLCAYIIAVPTLKLRKDYFALITMGFGEMMASIIVMLDKYTNGSIGFSRIPKVKNVFWIVVGLTVFVLFFAWALKRSRFGRMCIALKTDETAAKSFGVDTYRMKITVYVIGSVICGLAGILYGLKNRVITPDGFSWNLSAEMQIFLFFGGTNSLTGSALSAFFLKLIPETLRTVRIFGISLQEFRTVSYGLMILLVINFRPNGILGTKEFTWKGLVAFFRRLFAKKEAKK
ncbi:MAG: branched-chain amino acid ABC transporter permease [Sphaerochaetaceae bacterium]|nr:branched-chain amino acid ABC transporter permease [Sphaerochaetaceae bacterium]